jgi:hypothetical protein
MARWLTHNWQDGDVVEREFSNGAVLTGRAVVRGRAVRVQYVDMAGRQRDEWPDGWCIGSGALQRSCPDCGNEFRTKAQQEIFCPPCNRRSAGKSSAGFKVGQDYVGGRRRIG